MFTKKLFTILSALLFVLILVVGAFAEQMSLEELRAVTPDKSYKVGFANLHENHVFMWRVRESIQRNCEEYGLECVMANNNVDGMTALSNADTFVTQGVNGVVEFQSHVEFGEAIMEKFNDIGAPVIAIDIPMPGATFFGANNYEAGYLAGEGGGNYAKAHWDGRVDKLLSIELPQSGDVVMQRSRGMWEGVQAVTGLGDEDIIHLDGKETQDTARQVVCDALQGIPDAEYLVVTAVNDEMALGGLAAIETCGSSANQKNYIAVGQSADEAAQAAMREEGSHFAGSTAYFPERYGDYIIPALIRLMNGEKLPPELFMGHTFISIENLDQYYPKQ